MLKHRVQLRLATAEAFEQDHWLFRTAAAKDVVEERLAGFAIEDTLLFEAREGIRRQDVGPQIAVITRCVSAGENMAEGVRETAPRRPGDQRNVCLTARTGSGGMVQGSCGMRLFSFQV